MTEGLGEEVDKYTYFKDMSLGAIQEHMAGLRDTFTRLEKRYNGPVKV